MPISRAAFEIQLKAEAPNAFGETQAWLGTLEEPNADIKKARVTTEGSGSANTEVPGDIRINWDAFSQIGEQLQRLGAMARACLAPWTGAVAAPSPGDARQDNKENEDGGRPLSSAKSPSFAGHNTDAGDELFLRAPAQGGESEERPAARQLGNATEECEGNEMGGDDSFPSSNSIESHPVISRARAEIGSLGGPHPARVSAEDFQQVLDLLQELLDLMHAKEDATSRFAAQIDELRVQINELASRVDNNRTSP
ncbi:MAG: hypothetical protein ABSG59_10175 [Verrucomicrobiota bacterium]|jgi:hypothetical protein